VALAAGAGAFEAQALRHFTRVPDLAATTTSRHLLSGSGSGRWQFWKAALDEFEASPLHGGGAGSFADWWARHASFSYFVQDAHSLFFQTLGELGLIGLVLLVGALATGVVVAVCRLRSAAGAEQAAIAALLGTFTAYAIGASVDWMWELTAVTAVGVAALGLLTGPATLPSAPARPRRRLIPTVAVGLAGLAIAAVEAAPLLAGVEVSASQAAVRAGKTGAAEAHASDATRITPWAGSPYLQLALVEEAAGDLAGARHAAAESIRRDRDDWRPWYVASRIETELGDDAAAHGDLDHARALNPRSPLVDPGP
jgi:tetratricopeptide (TPR) repeat protein